MLANKLESILLNDSVENERVSEAAVFMAFYFEIGGDATAVAYYPSGSSLEFMGKRIGNMSDAAVFIAVGIVYRLDAASRRSIVLCSRDF